MYQKIIKFLSANKINYKTHGKNISTKKGVIGINCPFCNEDEGYHLGIFPNSGKYTCWRSPIHKGTIVYLFSYMTGYSLQDIKNILYDDIAMLDDFSLDMDNKKCYDTEVIGGVKSLEFLPEFRLVRDSYATNKFFNYLKFRGFDRIQDLVETYEIGCALTGDFANRIIFPLYMNDKLMTWIGRDISPNAFLRYKDLEISKSIRHAKYCLFNFDNLFNGNNILFITEGIFDALKLDWYTDNSIKATSIFTTSIRDEQISLLLQVSSLYKKIIITLDKGAEAAAYTLKDNLSFIKNVSVKFIPDEFKDVGEMSREEVQEFVSDLKRVL